MQKRVCSTEVTSPPRGGNADGVWMLLHDFSCGSHQPPSLASSSSNTLPAEPATAVFSTLLSRNRTWVTQIAARAGLHSEELECFASNFYVRFLKGL